MARKTLSIGKRTPKAAAPVVETVSSSNSFATSYSYGEAQDLTNITAEAPRRNRMSDSVGEDAFSGTVDDSIRDWDDETRSSSEGMATQEVLEQDYLSRMGSNMQSTLGMMARGDITAGSNSGSIRLAEAGLVLDNIAGGRDFHSVVGGAVPSPISNIDVVTGQVTGVSPYAVPQSEMNKALSYVENTLPEMMERGPGQRLNTNFQSGEAEQAHRLALQNAYAVIDNVVDKHYMSDRSRGSDVYGQRKEQAVAEMHEYILNSDLAGRGGRILPTPNEMETAGLVPTPAQRGGQNSTAAWTNWEYDTELSNRGLTRNTLDSANPLHQQLMGKAPSLDNMFSRVDWTGIDRNTTDPLQLALKSTRIQENWDRINGQRTLIKDASSLIRQDMITNRDESYGNRSRYTGLDDPYGEQAAAADFRSSLGSTLGMVGMNEWSGSDDSRLDQDTIDAHGKGSDQAGSYGYKENSDQEIAVQGMMSSWQDMVDSGTGGELASQILTNSSEAPSMRTASGPAGSAMAAYDLEIANSHRPTQGSPEWHKQREGLVTASQGKMLWKGKGDQRVAANIAERRLINDTLTGDAKDAALLRLDPSNAYTAMGNKYEDKARDTFLATEGKGLTFREAFFETNDAIAGMGASPDGRLFNEDGSSAGLLELKFLGEGGMKSALKDYTPQMQIQMAITGETQTQFYALDRETNEYEHQIIKADPKMQAELVALGQSALGLEGSINNAKELNAMKKGYKGARRVGTKAAADAGQTESFSNDVEAETPMTSFGSASEGQGSGGGSGVGGGVDANTVQQDMPGTGVKTDQALKAAKTAEAQAARDASRALKELQSSAKNAGAVLGELAGGLLGAGASGMDTVRLAGLSGMSTGAARGLEYAFQSDGMTPGDAKSTILAAGQMRTQYNTATQQSGAITNLIEKWSSAGLDQQLGFTPQISDFQNKSTQDIVATVQDWTGGLDRETRIQALTAINPALAHMSVLTMSGSDAGSAFGYTDEDGNRGFHYGAEGVRQKLQTAGEATAAASGEIGGAIAATADFALGSKTLSLAADKLLKLAGAGGLAAGASGLAAAAGGGLAALAASTSGVLAGAGSAIAGIGVGGLAVGGVALGTTGLAGYGVGSALREGYGALVGSTALGDAVFGAVDEVGAFFGHDDSQSRLDMNSMGQIQQTPGLNQVIKVDNKTDVTVNNTYDNKGNSTTDVEVNGDNEELSEKGSGDA